MPEMVKIDGAKLKRVIQEQWGTLERFYFQLNGLAFGAESGGGLRGAPKGPTLREWLETEDNGVRRPGAGERNLQNGIEGNMMRLGILIRLSKWLGRNFNDFLPSAKVPWAIPSRGWSRELAPASLLRSEYGVVDWHPGFREKELAELHAWCGLSRQLALRLVYGAGGMGKTRLGIQFCIEAQAQEDRRAGFLDYAAFRPDEQHWRELLADGDVVLVFDYAEHHLDVLSWLIPVVLERAPSAYSVRFLLLARDKGDWWTFLKTRKGVADLLGDGREAGVSFTHLDPMPLDSGNRLREACWTAAFKRFQGKLGIQTKGEPGLPLDLAKPHFGRVLLLHMSALAAVEGHEASGQQAIYDYVLGREQRFWEEQLKARGLRPTLFKGVRQLMAVLTSVRGAEDAEWCQRLIKELDIFQGEPNDVLDAIGLMLHECYPGPQAFLEADAEAGRPRPAGKWIEPLQPDPLGRYFAEKVLKADPTFAGRFAALVRRFGNQR